MAEAPATAVDSGGGEALIPQELNSACGDTESSEEDMMEVQRRRRKRRQYKLRIHTSDCEEDAQPDSELLQSDESTSTSQMPQESTSDHCDNDHSQLHIALSTDEPEQPAALLHSRDVYLKTWRTVNRKKRKGASERPVSPVSVHDLQSLQQRRLYFQELVRKEMAWLGLLPKWTAVLDNGRTRAGMTCFRSHRLSFSRHLIARGSPSEMRETILHECAHAIAGATHHHDHVWRNIAVRIGCSGETCHSIELAEPKWILFCPRGCWSQKCFKRTYLYRSCHCPTCGDVCEYRSAARSGC